MPTVLVNSDDLGLHPDIDRGILECIDAGAVQSVSYVATGRTIDWKLLRDLQQRGIFCGLHATLVGEPWGTDGRTFASWKQLVPRAILPGHGLKAAIEREIEHQLQLSLSNDVRPDHIDSHQHVHAFGPIWRQCLAIARRLNIRIRVPRAPAWSVIKKSPAGLALQALSSLRARSVPEALPCIGIARAGHNSVEDIDRELAASGGRDLELVMHPGVNSHDLQQRYGDWNFDWTGERDALLGRQFMQVLARHGYTMAPPRRDRA